MGATSTSWAERSVRRFRWMLCGMSIAFVTTQFIALAGWVPHLHPVSLRSLFSNIYFAIGFGSPLLLYVSSLPGWRELARTAGLGLGVSLILAVVLAMFDVPGTPGISVEKLAAVVNDCLVIASLGIASIITLSVRAWRSVGPERTAVLIYLLPAGVALLYTLEAGLFLEVISVVPHLTYDSYAYVADQGYGGQLSFWMGRLFAHWPLLAGICLVIYSAPPPCLMFVYAVQVKQRRYVPVDAVTALLTLGLVGYAFYAIMPVSGPKPAFGDAFPDAPPPVDDLIGRRIPVGHFPRNGMPSLHLGSVLLAYWQARPYGPWARGAAAIVVFGTLLATLGLGEHYLVDLVVGLPFALAVQAALIPGLPELRARRNAAFLGAAGLVAGWYALLLHATHLLLHFPALTWGATIGTVAVALFLERRLYRATLALPDKDVVPVAAKGAEP
jgi:hypothetical protein